MSGGRLGEIVRHKADEIEERKRRSGLEGLRDACRDMGPCRGFRVALARESGEGRLGVVAEAKRRSPSAGDISVGDDTAGRVSLYERGGATCVSVLTDTRYFGGANGDLELARSACSLPLLRKDFVIDPWQVYETRALGADCMLLIVAALPRDGLAELAGLAIDVGLDVLVEIHSEDEAEAALAAGTDLLGVNNRDLTTFETDLSVSERIVPSLRGEGRVVVAESAIADAADAGRMRDCGADAVLVGEALMKAGDVSGLVQSMRKAGSG